MSLFHSSHLICSLKTFFFKRGYRVRGIGYSKKAPYTPYSLHPIRYTLGFTIVETLVAIAILMIAVAGPLVVATKGLTSAAVAKNQMIATFLAQESLEVIKNRRDNDTHLGTSGNEWLNVVEANGTTQVNLLGCIESAPCDASLLKPTAYFTTTCNTPSPVDSLKNSCRLFVNESVGYLPGNNESSISGFGATFTPSQFYRRFYVVPVAGSNPAEVSVHVIVDWLEGTVPYQTHITSQLVNVIR